MHKTPTQWLAEPLRRYAQFSGRAQRAEFWWFYLLVLVINIVGLIVDRALSLTPFGLRLVTSIVLIVPHSALAVRRLHDIDRTGWWFAGVILLGVLGGSIRSWLRWGNDVTVGSLAVVTMALFVWAIVLLFWFCKHGTVGPNRFGLDPLALDDGAIVAVA